MLPLFATFEPHPEIACSSAEFDPAIHKATYRYNYPEIFKHIASHPKEAQSILRPICKTDRFFLAYFVAGWEDGKSSGNKPFIVNMCRMDEEGIQSGTVDVWAREHGKSACLTIAGTVQRVLNDPECTTAIFSFRKSAADKFLDSVRKVFESNFMIWLFPDIFYEKPETQSPSWSLQGGIRVKRKNQIRRENTVEAFGLVEGAPIGGHFDHRIYDDIETDVMARNPDQLLQCYESLLMSRALGREGGTERIIGTYYSHCGVLVRLGEKKDIQGKNMYQLRIYPATDDGTITGNPIFFSQEYLDDKKTDSGFNTQYLCNPTPVHDIKLDFNMLQPIEPYQLPKCRIKFVIIDGAGDDEVQTGNNNDSFTALCVSINPVLDDLGCSDVFLEDIISDTMSLAAQKDAACQVYMRNGRIAMIGVEKVANDTTYDQVKNALRSRGRYVEVKLNKRSSGNMVLLKPAGRTKVRRIEVALSWPLCNSKLFYSTDIPPYYIDKIKEEMNKFPFFHVDILDAWAYLWDILADWYEFLPEEDENEQEEYEDEEQGRSVYGGY